MIFCCVILVETETVANNVDAEEERDDFRSNSSSEGGRLFIDENRTDDDFENERSRQREETFEVSCNSSQINDRIVSDSSSLSESSKSAKPRKKHYYVFNSTKNPSKCSKSSNSSSCTVESCDCAHLKHPSAFVVDVENAHSIIMQEPEYCSRKTSSLSKSRHKRKFFRSSNPDLLQQLLHENMQLKRQVKYYKKKWMAK